MSYREHAYERTFVAHLQRYVLDNYLQSDSSPKDAMICEEVFVAESHIPQEYLQKFFEKLQFWENAARTKMSEYKMMKDEPILPFLDKPERPEAKKKNATKSKQKKKSKPEPTGEGSPTGE